MTTTEHNVETSLVRGTPEYNVAKAKDWLLGEKMQVMFQEAGLDPRRIARVALMAQSQNPTLQKCDPKSFCGAVIKSAMLKLYPDGRMAAIVPYKGKAQFQPMYRGLNALAYRSGIVAAFSAEPVFEGDTFDFTLGTGAYIKHQPSGNPDQVRTLDTLNYVYACVWVKGGGDRPSFKVLDKSRILYHRDKSSGFAAFKQGKIRESPWATFPVEMAKKSALIELSSVAPFGDDMQAAVEFDTMVEIGKDQQNEAEMAEYEEVEDEGDDA